MQSVNVTKENSAVFFFFLSVDIEDINGSFFFENSSTQLLKTL